VQDSAFVQLFSIRCLPHCHSFRRNLTSAGILPYEVTAHQNLKNTGSIHINVTLKRVHIGVIAMEK
jgi:hypothetical protein